MREWYSIAELADLHGLLMTVSATIRKSKRENWLSRPREGRGGGYEYHISSLPTETQEALRLKHVNDKIQELSADPNFQAGKAEGIKLRIREEISKEVIQKNKLTSLVKAEGLSDVAKDRMNAKLEVLKAFEVFKENCPDSVTSAQFQFCAAYNKGTITVSNWVLDVLPRISQPSLLKWIKATKTEGISALAGKYGNRKGSSIIDSNFELNKFALAMLEEFPHMSAKHLFRAICARFSTARFQLPSERTTERWLSKWKEEHKELYMFMTAPDQWKNKFMLAVGSTTESVERYLQVLQMDSTPTDIMLADGRYAILGIIDVWSRRVKMLVCKTSKASAVASLIRRVVLDWGVPESIKMDNGADYASKHVSRVLEALEVKQVFCTPYQPWEKPEIERVFKSFSHGLLELCPQFLGHNVAERISIEERKSFAERLIKKNEKNEVLGLGTINGEFLTAQQLQEICDKWSEGLYFTENHEELGMSPSKKVASYEGTIRKIGADSIRGLDVLLAPVAGNDGKRVVTKKGVSVNNFDYWSDELIGCVGKTVLVSEDLTDVGKIVVYTSELKFLCVAVCPELVGIKRAELAVTAKAKQFERIREKRKELKALTRDTNVKNIANEILDHYVAKANEFEQSSCESVEEYTTRRLEAAAEAAIVIEELDRDTNFEFVERDSAVSAESEHKLAEIVRLDLRRESDEERENREKSERIKKYEALLAQNFINISDEDEKWRKSWETTPEFRIWSMFKEAFESKEQA